MCQNFQNRRCSWGFNAKSGHETASNPVVRFPSQIWEDVDQLLGLQLSTWPKREISSGPINASAAERRGSCFRHLLLLPLVSRRSQERLPQRESAYSHAGLWTATMYFNASNRVRISGYMFNLSLTPSNIIMWPPPYLFSLKMCSFLLSSPWTGVGTVVMYTEVVILLESV